MFDRDPPTFRIVPPPPGRASPARDDPVAREARIVAWERYYASGPGFDRAIKEAWRYAVKRGFTRCGFQDAAQYVGWSTGQLLWALDRRGYTRKIPERLHDWARNHVARYRKDRT